MAKILITDGGYNHTLGIVRSLSKAGHIVDCIGSKVSLSRFSRYLGKVAYSQKKFNDSHIADFIRFMVQSDYDQIIPVGGKSVDFLSRNRKKLQDIVRLELADRCSIDSCLNKKTTLKIAEQVGVPYPESWTFSTIEEYSNESLDFKFPLVIKGISELNKSEPTYIHNKEGLDLEIKKNRGREFPLIQQYIEGEGVGFFALYDRGQLKRYFMHRRVRENPPTGGVSVCAVSIYDGKLLHYGRRLLDTLKWHGVAMVEFKRDRSSGELYLMEINPKLWGSHDLAIASGMDFARALIDMSTGSLSDKYENYKIGVKYHWPVVGDIQHVFKKPSSFAAVFSDSVNPKVRTNILLTDPLPHLWVFSIFALKSILRCCRLIKHIHRARRIGIYGAIVRLLTEFSGIPILRYSMIEEGIAVGMQHSWIGKRILEAHHFNATLNLRSEFNDYAKGLSLAECKQIPIEEFTAPSIDQLNDGVNFISRIIDRGGKVYIHCREGVSRAPLFAAAYLIKERDYSVEEAVARISQRRFFVNILDNQMEVLRAFALIQRS